MQCPCCDRAMRSGYLQNHGQPVQWIPDGAKPSIWRGGIAREGVPLSAESSWFKGCTVEAHYCGFCKLVIAPVKK